MRRAIHRLWPPSRAPRLRAGLRRPARALKAWITRDLPYRTWQWWSLRRHGRVRAVGLRSGVDLVVRSDDFRAFRIAQTGGTQDEKVAVWKELATALPSLALDVGANYGEFTMAIAGTGIATLAVEANPGVAACLRQTVANHPHVTVLEAAAAAEPGEAVLYLNERSSGSASLAPDSPEQERRTQRRSGAVKAISVPRVRLCDAVTERGLDVTRGLIVKVDVEGFESQVLRGLTPLLHATPWWRALVEFGQSTIRAAGGDPATVWMELRRFPGIVVSEAGARTPPHEAVRRALCVDIDTRLPEAMPTEADVLIGQGPLPHHA